MKRVSGYVRSKQNGAGIPGINVTILDDLTGNAIPGGGIYGAAANPVATDSNGFFTWTSELSPGPVRLSADIPEGAEVKVRSGKETMQVGDIFLSDIPDMMKYWTFGVVKEDLVTNPLLVQPVTGQRKVRILPGLANMRGYVFRINADRIIDIDANTTLANRIDLVVLEQHVDGTAKGRQSIAIVKGVTNGVEPSTNADPNVFQFPIGRVTVPQSATSVSVADIRIFSAPTYSIVGANSVGSAQIIDGSIAAVDLAPGAVTENKIQDAAVNHTKITDNAVSTAKIQNSAITADKLAASAVTTPKITDGSVTFEKLSSTMQSQWLTWILEGTLGGGSNKTPVFKDTNFGFTGTVTSNRKLGEATISIGEGTFLVESTLNATIVGNGSAGYTKFWLAGSGTPQGADASERNFYHVGGVPRQVVLTGRRVITGPATLKVEAWCAHHSGDTSAAYDGVVFIKGS